MNELTSVDGKSDTEVRLKLSKIEIAYLEEDIETGDCNDGDIHNAKNIFLDIENNNIENYIENNTTMLKSDTEKHNVDNDDNVDIVDDNVDNIDDNDSIDDVNDISLNIRDSDVDEPVVRNGSKMIPFEVEKALGQHMKILEDEIVTKRQIRRRRTCINGFKNCVFYSFLLYLFLFVNLYLILLFELPIRKFLHIDSHNITITDNSGIGYYAGADGANGAAGADGVNGTDGAAGAIVFFNSTEYLAKLVDNITLLVLSKISDNGVLNIREIKSDVLHSTDLVVNTGNFTFIKSINIDSTHYIGSTFNRCVSGWC